MNRKLIIALLFVGALSFAGNAQTPVNGQIANGVKFVSSAPAGACTMSKGERQQVIGTGEVWYCKAGTWTKFGDASGAPGGSAGGALDGTYPNPGIAASVAGDGLAESTNVLSVNVDGSTLETNSDTLRVKDAGIVAAKIASDAVVTAKILDANVTNAKLADMAEATIKGRAAGAGTGAPVDLTATQATAILNAVVGDSGSGGTKGLAPAPGAGDAAAGKFLKADGTYQVPFNSSSLTGVEFGFLSSLPSKRFLQAQPPSTVAASYDNLGGWAITGTGTAANASASDGVFVRQTSVATTGQSASQASSGVVTRAEWQPEIVWRFKTYTSISNARFWVGLASTSPGSSATPAVHYGAFRYDTVADGTAFWRVCSDNASGTPEVTVTSLAVATSTYYHIGVTMTGTAVKFYAMIGGVWTLLATHTGTVPTASTTLLVYLQVTTLENVAKSIEASTVKMMTY